MAFTTRIKLRNGTTATYWRLDYLAVSKATREAFARFVPYADAEAAESAGQQTAELWLRGEDYDTWVKGRQGVDLEAQLYLAAEELGVVSDYGDPAPGGRRSLFKSGDSELTAAQMLRLRAARTARAPLVHE